MLVSRPPPFSAELSLTVTLISESVPASLDRPPPRTPEVLPVTVLLTSVAVAVRAEPDRRRRPCRRNCR